MSRHHYHAAPSTAQQPRPPRSYPPAPPVNAPGTASSSRPAEPQPKEDLVWELAAMLREADKRYEEEWKDVEFKKPAIPKEPYILSVPSDVPYSRAQNERGNWRKDTTFDPDEEHLQYATFNYRRGYPHSIFSCQTQEEYVASRRPAAEEITVKPAVATNGAAAASRATTPATPAQTGPRRKFTLKEYSIRNPDKVAGGKKVAGDVEKEEGDSAKPLPNAVHAAEEGEDGQVREDGEEEEEEKGHAVDIGPGKERGSVQPVKEELAVERDENSGGGPAFPAAGQKRSREDPQSSAHSIGDTQSEAGPPVKKARTRLTSPAANHPPIPPSSMQAEVKMEVRAEASPKIKPETQQEAKQEIKPETQQGAKQEVKSEVKSDVVKAKSASDSTTSKQPRVAPKPPPCLVGTITIPPELSSPSPKLPDRAVFEIRSAMLVDLGKPKPSQRQAYSASSSLQTELQHGKRSDSRSVAPSKPAERPQSSSSPGNSESSSERRSPRRLVGKERQHQKGVAKVITKRARAEDEEEPFIDDEPPARAIKRPATDKSKAQLELRDKDTALVKEAGEKRRRLLVRLPYSRKAYKEIKSILTRSPKRPARRDGTGTVSSSATQASAKAPVKPLETGKKQSTTSTKEQVKEPTKAKDFSPKAESKPLPSAAPVRLQSAHLTPSNRAEKHPRPPNTDSRPEKPDLKRRKAAPDTLEVPNKKLPQTPTAATTSSRSPGIAKPLSGRQPTPNKEATRPGELREKPAEPASNNGVKTPQTSAPTSTPTASGSTPLSHSAAVATALQRSNTTDSSHPRAKEIFAHHNESCRLRKLGKSLKESFQSTLAHIQSIKATPVSTVSKACSVAGVESLMAYVLSFQNQDYIAAALKNNPHEAWWQWRSMITTWQWFCREVRHHKLLWGLAKQIGYTILARMADLDPVTDAAVHHDLMKQAGLDGERALPLETIMKEFPRTWKGRRSGFDGDEDTEAGVELTQVEKYAGDYYLPLTGVASSPLQAVRTGVALLKEFAEQEHLKWEPRLKL